MFVVVLLPDAKTSEIATSGAARPTRRRSYRRLPVRFQRSSLPYYPGTLWPGSFTYLLFFSATMLLNGCI